MRGIGGYSISELAISAAVVSAVVIVARFVWMYPATYLPRWLFPAIRRKDPSPPWQWPFALAFTGVRGIVSLAAALAIPLTTESGQPFPDRDLILFLTFAVILVTLVGQGLMLPAVIRVLGLAHAGRRERHADRAEEYQGPAAGDRGGDRAARPAGGGTPALGGGRAAAARPAARPAQAPRESRRRCGHSKLTELHDEIELLLIAAERAADQRSLIATAS